MNSAWEATWCGAALWAPPWWHRGSTEHLEHCLRAKTNPLFIYFFLQACCWRLSRSITMFRLANSSSGFPSCWPAEWIFLTGTGWVHLLQANMEWHHTAAPWLVVCPRDSKWTDTSWAHAWQVGPHLNGGDIYFCGVKTSKIRTAEGLPTVIFKLMLAGRVVNVMWLTVHDKQHCFIATMCFVGIQATWGSLGDEIWRL